MSYGNQKLPCETCNAKCCTYPVFTPKEFDHVSKTHGVSVFAKRVPLPKGHIMVFLDGGNCPYIKNGGCGIYEDRPRVCRLYGEIKEMPCKVLYPKEAEARSKMGFNATMFLK